MTDNNNLYTDKLGEYIHRVVKQSKICRLVVELLQFEVGVHGWCSSKTGMKIILSFPAEERVVLMRGSINHSNLF